MESSALRPLSLPQDLWSRGPCLPTGSKGRGLQANGFAQGQASSPEEANGGQEDGRTEEVGAAVVAGCNGPPVLLSGKKILDFVILAIQPPAVMDWFPAAATGRDARRDALPDQHLMDFVPVLPLIPHHRGRRRQVFESHIRTGEVTALPLTQVEPQATTFTATDPIGACWSCPPLLRLDAVGWALMSVASTIRTSGSGASGGSAELDTDNSEKISSKTPLSHQRWKRL